MIFERIESKGLAHYSYLIGDGIEAAVIDPRRDCAIYVEKAQQAGVRITTILETHRNEDYAIGSVELAARTGAEIWHADAQLDYQYGRPVQEGQIWRVGEFTLQAIHSPGHTLGSMSYLLRDASGAPWKLFTGDALFAGEVGRVDFLGMDRAPEMAGHLYETIFEKFIPLGDGVIIYPAHGSGSACGSAIAARAWTTIGLERQFNPRLQFTDREAFITNVARQLAKPPYFDRMEEWNLIGAPLLGSLPVPPPLSADAFAAKAKDAIVLDARMELAFGAAHVPSAISIWPNGVAAHAGWQLPYDQPILLVCEQHDLVEITRYLIRIGYDDLVGYLAEGMYAWHNAGYESESVTMITVQHLCRHLDAYEDITVLDVRSEEELETSGAIPDAIHIHVKELPRRMDEVPRDQPVYIFCGTGVRSMMAASLMQREGIADPTVVLGGLSGWNSTTCPIDL